MSRGGGAPPPEDLEAFVADQYDRVRGALALFTGDRRLAEELAQEVFVKVCQHWERVRDMDAPGAWAHRVGVNLAISRARRRRTELRVVERVRAERRPHVPGADEALADEALRAALAELPPDERAALVLRFHADLSVADTAGALGIPEGTVKTRTRRALAHLRAVGLAAGDEDGPEDDGDRAGAADARAGAAVEGEGSAP